MQHFVSPGCLIQLAPEVLKKVQHESAASLEKDFVGILDVRHQVF